VPLESLLSSLEAGPLGDEAAAEGAEQRRGHVLGVVVKVLSSLSDRAEHGEFGRLFALWRVTIQLDIRG